MIGFIRTGELENWRIGKLFGLVRHLYGSLLLGCLVSASLWAQSSGDTLHFSLDEIVVVGDRSESVLKESTTPTSVLTRELLDKIPARNLIDALKYVPGLTFVEQDASGHIPMAIVRGFFGGGEAEYVLVYVDGIPMNDLRNGLINWNRIPLENIERIEVSRGGGSAMYGDMALGAVINITTRADGASNTLVAGAKFGQYERQSADLFSRRDLSGNPLSLHATIDKSKGYREHAEGQNLNVGGRYDVNLASGARIILSVDAGQLDKDDPGPLLQAQVDGDPRQANSLFSADNRLRNQLNATAGYRSSSEKDMQISVEVGMRRLAQEHTRTLQIASNFGDTQFHDESNSALWSQLKVERKTESARVIAGIDAEVGSFDAEYRDPVVDTLFNAGEGNRTKLGAFLEAKMELGNRINGTAGVRYDRIANEGGPTGGTQEEATFSEFSPRIGLNFEYSTSDNSSGHIFASWSQAFKAPTLDQLYDQRTLFFGFPIVFSTTELEPQTSNNFDIGLYQQFVSSSGRVVVELSLAGYLLDIDNEIDLDLATFKYGNILKSRHQGIEASAGLQIANVLNTNHALTISEATFESGEHTGNTLKNIPRAALANAIQILLPARVTATISHNYFSKVYLDDANLTTLPSFSSLNGRLTLDVDRFRISLDIRNITDSEYVSSGYVLFDPFIERNVHFLYPATGRFIEGGVQYRL